MESETIDLTDPLEQLLRQTGWTPEYLQERLLKITKENTGESNANTKDVKDLTLTDLLEGFPCSRNEVSKTAEASVTIELSDDEDDDVVIMNETENENEVTEVRVIEVDDDSSQSEHNDDDDEFMEAPRDSTILSNDVLDFDHIGDSSLSTDFIPNEKNLRTISNGVSENTEDNIDSSNKCGTINSGKEKLNENIEISVDNRIVGEKNPSSEISKISTIEEGNVRNSDTSYLLQNELFDNDQTHNLGFKVSSIQGGITLIDSPSQLPINTDSSENYGFSISSIQDSSSLMDSPSQLSGSTDRIDNTIENYIPTELSCKIPTKSSIPNNLTFSDVSLHSSTKNVEDIGKTTLAQENAIVSANHSINSVDKRQIDSETKCNEDQMDPCPENKSINNDITMDSRCKNDQRHSFYSEFFNRDKSTQPLEGETNICSTSNNSSQNDYNINLNLNMDCSSDELSKKIRETMKTCDTKSDAQCKSETGYSSKKNYQSKSLNDLQSIEIYNKPLTIEKYMPNTDTEPEKERIITINKNSDNSDESSEDSTRRDNLPKYGNFSLEEQFINDPFKENSEKKGNGIVSIGDLCKIDLSNAQENCVEPPNAVSNKPALNITTPFSSENSNSRTESTDNTLELLDKGNYSLTDNIPENSKEPCNYISLPRIDISGRSENNTFTRETLLENDNTKESFNKINQMDTSNTKNKDLESLNTRSCKSSLNVGLSGPSEHTEFINNIDLEKSENKIILGEGNKSVINIVQQKYNEPITEQARKLSSSGSLVSLSKITTLSTGNDLNIIVSEESLNDVESSGIQKTCMESSVAETKITIPNEHNDAITDFEEKDSLKNSVLSCGTDQELHDSNKDDEEGDQDDNKGEHSASNLEEIRKNLKLQLSQLRNRKRMDIMHDPKIRDINLEFSKSCIFPKKIPDNSLDSVQSGVGSKKIEINHTQEETNAGEKPTIQHVIAVIPPFSKISEPETTIEKQEDEELPNVLQEIRNIIKKQRSTPRVHNSLTKSYKNPASAHTEDDQDSEKSNISISNNTIDDKKDLQIMPASNSANRPTTSNSVVNSPFVSNSLDNFLTDAKLNVSYAIPKSGAEEGLRQNYSDEPVMPPIVAEIKEENTGKATQDTKYKPKTLAEKRRLLEKVKIKEKKQKERLKKLEEAQKRSYVLYKDKKIFLKAKSRGKCIASIDSSVPVPINISSVAATPKKPSLLTELYKKAFTPPKYKPGPLCKKHLLQTDYSNWTTELKTLPKVILEVMPEVGKPIHPNLCHILQKWDGDVTENQIEFALSALFTKKGQKQNNVFKFDVAYENHQTQILTRKKSPEKPVFKFERSVLKKEFSSTPEDDVAEVVEKLLNYVEIKEMEPTLIKEDEDFSTVGEDPLDTAKLTIDNHVLVKRKSRFTKTDRELLRLNCKVVSVEVEDNEPEEMCSKPYCRLGCICKSLKCEKIIGLHCQKAKCIFGCTCPKEKDKIISISEQTIKLPAGSDLLSTATVTRIEGEAKRNLARVEKEFTQTVIHTNDKTIVVGFGSKPRRATKTPKKYIDFFDEEIPKEDCKEEKKDLLKIRQCYVNLERWKFSDIIPYCLVHRLYTCHCRGLSLFSSNIPKSSTKEEKNNSLSVNKYKKGDDSFAKEGDLNSRSKLTVEESFKAIVRKNAVLKRNADDDDDSEETLYSVTGRPLRKKKKIYEADFIFDGESTSATRKHSELESSLQKPQILEDWESSQCSRTQEIDSKYYKKIRTFSNAVFACDFANNLTQADLVRAEIQKNDDNISEADFLKRYILQERNNQLKKIETEIHKKKRKQKIQVRRDEDIVIKIKKGGKSQRSVRKHKVKSVFKGEIIVNESEWLKKLGQNTKQPLEGYARILPWTALLKGFLSKSLNIYCLSDTPLRLLLNVGSKLKGEKLMDVETCGYNIINSPLRIKTPWLLKQSENVRDIIRWLLSGTLPLKYKNTSLSFLLVETLPDQFEVRGLCTQEENKQGHEKNKADLSEEGEIFDHVTEVKHKDMNNDVQSLFITKAKFRLRELVEDGVEDDLADNLYMWVGLPEVYKVAKWRVILLKNDFSYLYFKKIKYSIKYTDLSRLIQMAKGEMLTLILRNVQIRRNYDHTSFGLYISHNYADRIFIGPYFVNYDEDDIETLRYINQSLVSSESFNKMTGNPNHRCGHWMYERKYYHTPKVYMKDTIDLTKDESPPKALKTLKPIPPVSTNSVSAATSITPTISIVSSHSVQQNVSKDEHVIYHNGMAILIKNSKPRSPSEFNRFIITNIPHFGYLGAYQPDNSSALEVSWPFEKKVLQFQNADSARDFLQERFNQLLQPVPESFKIQVIVLLQLDLTEHQPINSDFLSGHCICGYFGTYNFRELSPEFCLEKLNISKEEITKLFARRAHAYIRKKIEELAEIVGISQTNPIDFNVPSILKKAKEEIKLQENIRKQQISEIHSYELNAVSKLRKLHEMVKDLPLKERNIESKIITEILQIRPNRITGTEIVEIKDDDEPNQSQKEESRPVVNDVESVDPQLMRNPLKREICDNESVQNTKVAKVSPYVGPSKTLSILKVKQQPKSKPSTSGKTIVPTVKKQNVLIVRPHQTKVTPVITIDDENEKEINYASEDKSADTPNTKLGYDISQYFVECDYTDTNETDITEIVPQLSVMPESDSSKPRTLKTYSKKTDALTSTSLNLDTSILHTSQQSESAL